jgi:hypothetical protein
MIGAVRAYGDGSDSEQQMTTRRDDLNELATSVSAAIARAKQLNLPTSVYILSMVQVEVSQALQAVVAQKQDDEVG